MGDGRKYHVDILPQAQKAIAEYKKNPVNIPIDEVWKKLGIP